jgi:hypothetical protein
VHDEIDFDEANLGLGLRYYFTHLVFIEAGALRNSNRGLAVPVSAGLDLKIASLEQACNQNMMPSIRLSHLPGPDWM